ncbi:DUF4190 domain-containing protein [Microbacterium sp. NPDC057407]|uniref:DUF4190 domain-containing protein n=1 Tax=Microbacterium sp. NPDC057407 TaxID=3346120 RepID=UPI00366F858D
MSDPQNPADPPASNVPPAPPAYGQPQTPPPAYGQPQSPPPGYGQPQYPAAPPPAYGPPADTAVPGRTLGIVAFILSFFVQLIALILGIVALVQSRKAGQKNGWALAAIIISSVLIVIGIIVLIIVFAVIVPAATAEFLRLCSEYGNGVHEIGGTTITLSGCP